MKVLLIQTDIPKHIEETTKFNRCVSVMVSLVNRMYGGLSVERGFFMKSLDITDTKQDTIIFCDEYLHPKIVDSLNYIVSNFDGVNYTIKDITLDVKLDRCVEPSFNTLFESEVSDFNDISNLQTYIEGYLTFDDVLTKITDSGIGSLNDFDMFVLNEASNNLK